jgi:hypothetical protein
MSQINTNFLQGVQTGVQNAGQATQNFQVKQQALQAQQAMGLERQKMEQQGQQFASGQRAEAENYRLLNASRERMSAQEMAQQSGQFNQKMAYDKQQAEAEKSLALGLQKIETHRRKVDQDIAAMADNDPGLIALRARARDLGKKKIDLEHTMASLNASRAMADGLKGERMKEVDTRLTQVAEGHKLRRTQADSAVARGIDMALTQNARGAGYWQGIANVAAQDGKPGPDGQIAQQGGPTTGAMGAMTRVLYDSIKQYFGAMGDEQLVALKATEFEKNGYFMATNIVGNVLELGGANFGLDKGNQEKGKILAAQIVADAAIVGHVGTKASWSDESMQARRQNIARRVNELRDSGMGDEQIASLFDGLQSMGMNQDKLLSQYEVTDVSGRAPLLKKSLDGVAKIADVIHGVMADSQLMGPNGGVLVDHSKYDTQSVMAKARLAYGTTSGKDLESLVADLQSQRMPKAEMNAILKSVIESDPRLKSLRPEDILAAIEAGGREQSLTEQELGTAESDYRRQSSQRVAQDRSRGLGTEADMLDELARSNNNG